MFTAAGATGTISANCRFQVGVATALSVVGQYVDDVFQIAVEVAYESRLLEEIAEILPDGVELGLHFCFRDFEFNGFPLPADLDRIVDLTNGISGLVGRSIDWIHFPVPKHTRDGNYFAPVEQLNLHDKTQLFLGVIHTGDDIAMTRHQIALAAQRVASFGVASECGLGDLAASEITPVLVKHRSIAGPR